MQRKKAVQEVFKEERRAEEREERLMAELADLEAGLRDPSRRPSSLGQLRSRLTGLSRQANAPEDSPGRRMARRALRGTLVGAMERVRDADYRKLLEEVRPASGGGGQQGPRLLAPVR